MSSRILLILIIFCGHITFASEDCPNNPRVLIFSNGMFNSRYQASQSVFHLLGKYGASFTEYKIAYNHNEFPVEQLLEVFEQKAKATERFFWSYLTNLSYFSWFKDDILSKIKSIDSNSYVKDSDLRSHIELYKEHLNRNNKIVIVAHSQGNFYANKSYDLLNNNLNSSITERIIIVSVANPDNRVADNSDYTTLESDGVIKYIPLALPPNISNSRAGIFDHAFVEHYLEGDSSGPRIDSFIKATLSNNMNEGSNFDDEGFLHKSLTPMKEWLAKKRVQNSSKLNLKECLAVSLFLKVENLFGEDCKTRNFDTVKDIANECFEMEWKDDGDKLHYVCGLVGLYQTAHIYNSSANEMTILGLHHPECRWENGKVSLKLNRALLDDALEFIQKPD